MSQVQILLTGFVWLLNLRLCIERRMRDVGQDFSLCISNEVRMENADLRKVELTCH